MPGLIGIIDKRKYGMKRDSLNLFYSGGSGGFLLLHLLLLSGRYHVEFKNNVAMHTALSEQWKITNHQLWKKSETWPDNEKTFHSHSELTKIYYYCNPYNIALPPDHVDYHGIFGEYSNYNVGLYTDYASQVLLAKYKKAWQFVYTDTMINQKFSALRKFSQTWRTHYNNIRDPGWPDCNSIKKIDRLPSVVKQEVMDNIYTQQLLGFKYTSDYQGQEVYTEILPFLKSADMTLKLQDLVNHTEHVLYEVFGIDHVNDQQKKLIEHWKTLHPIHLLTAVGIISTDT